MNKVSIFLVFLVAACGGGGGSSSTPEVNNNSLEIFISGLNTNGLSFESQNISLSSSNNSCRYLVQNEDLIHLETLDSRNFSFRNPILYEGSRSYEINFITIPASNCPLASKKVSMIVNKSPTQFEAIPENIQNLATEYYQVNDIGFGGIVISDRYSATICYPTPNDCTSYENELFGQDAHNMIYGDFNGDGYEDFAVAWAIFPHTLEESKKIDAPINIYLNNRVGGFSEDLSIYYSGAAPTHPFAYRILAEDFNGDGVDDIFAGSMGRQYRSEDYSENYIRP